MKLTIISGRSGSGKSTCLNVLEDLDYYCVDNIPVSLMAELASRVKPDACGNERNVAISIDARNLPDELQHFPGIFDDLLAVSGVEPRIIYLDADDNTLIKRFSETRRKHPLSNEQISLQEALRREKTLLSPISGLAHLTIDTSALSLHQLRDIVKNRVAEQDGQGLALMFQSFGFKHGIPADADLLFDARCLPNPYWTEDLRAKTGLDAEVISFLEQHEDVHAMYDDIRSFLERWLPSYEKNNRHYITVAIGCTGGQHRSVYLCERLRQHFSQRIENTQIRHKEFA